MEKVREPVFVLEYGHKDITAHISPYVMSVTYTDKEHGESDEIDVQIEDREHLWKSSWYPTKGDLLTLRIGYKGERLLPCGDFEVDEVETSGPPDVINIKALATPITAALRQDNTIAYEQMSLAQIAEAVAKKHNLTLVGAPSDVKVKRITQHKERDLAFLKRLAGDYGYAFKVTSGRLVFFEKAKLEAAPSVYTIDRKDALTWSLKDKTAEVYKAATAAYHDPESKQLITHTEQAPGSVAKGDTLKVNERCESKQQAIEKTKAALAAKNGAQTEGSVAVTGTPLLVAGSNVVLSGFYKFNGTYHITSSAHSIDRGSGYRTSLEVKRV